MLAGMLALVIAAFFSGAAVYINLAEHPARMTLPMDMAVRQWRPAYKRGFAMQASLAIAGGMMAIWQWQISSQGIWLAGGLLLLANWPFTLLAIMPANSRLLADPVAGEATSLLRRWNRLHAVRSILGLLATAVLFMAAFE